MNLANEEGADRPRRLPEPLRSAAGLVFVDDLEALEVDDGDAHHLVAVLRVGPTETVIAADGRGRWRTCVLRRGARVDGAGPAGRVPATGRRGGRGTSRAAEIGVVLEPTGPIEHDPAPVRPVTVGFAMTKGDRTEWTVQKLTELGVDRIWPLITERTVVRLGADDAERRVARLRRVAHEAAAQSRRPWLPEVREPSGLARALEELDLGSPAALLAEPGGGALSEATTAILVGPEGGWSKEELASGLDPVDLGATVLRAETASIVAGALLTAVRAGCVRAR